MNAHREVKFTSGVIGKPADGATAHQTSSIEKAAIHPKINCLPSKAIVEGTFLVEEVNQFHSHVCQGSTSTTCSSLVPSRKTQSALATVSFSSEQIRQVCCSRHEKKPANEIA